MGVQRFLKPPNSVLNPPDAVFDSLDPFVKFANAEPDLSDICGQVIEFRVGSVNGAIDPREAIFMPQDMSFQVGDALFQGLRHDDGV